MVKTASCVVVGNEILSGKTRDSNAHHLARWLRQQGVDLQRIQIIPDEVDIIGGVVAEESARSEVVFTSGGVGPTHDDVTYQGVAKGLGLSISRHPDVAARMHAHYGGNAGEVRLRMADLPRPAQVLEVPGLWVPIVRARNVYILPGVPLLFERMLDALAPHVVGERITLHSIYTMQGESELAPLLEQVLKQVPGVVIGSYPRLDPAEYRVRVTLESRDPALCARALDHLIAKLDATRLVKVERQPP